MTDSVFSRINYLRQAIERLASDDNVSAHLSLIHHYSKCLATVAEKKVLRVDPAIKRSLCRKCHMYLKPGLTCTVRLRSGRQKHRVITCLLCHHVRRFNTSDDKFFSHSADGTPRSEPAAAAPTPMPQPHGATNRAGKKAGNKAARANPAGPQPFYSVSEGNVAGQPYYF